MTSLLEQIVDSSLSKQGQNNDKLNNIVDLSMQDKLAPSFIERRINDLTSAPGNFIKTVESIPSGISNLMHLPGDIADATKDAINLGRSSVFGSVFTPANTDYNRLNRTFHGIGGLAAYTLGGGPLAGAVTGKLFDKANQLTGADAPTSASQDLEDIASNATQNLVLNTLGEGISAIPDVFKPVQAAKSVVNKVIGPQSEQAAKAEVGKALENFVSPEELKQGMKDASDNSMAGYRSTAEVANSPELAMLEQQVGTTSPEYAKYNQDRNIAREYLLGQTIGEPLKAPGEAIPIINKEVTGDVAQKAIGELYQASKDAVTQEYNKIPADQTANIVPIKSAITGFVNKYYGPLPGKVPADLKYIFDRIKSSGKEATVGDLQIFRSNIGDVAEAAKRAGDGTALAVATAIHNKIADVISKVPEWKNANAKYRAHAELFKNGPLDKITDIDASAVMGKILSKPEAAEQLVNIAQDRPELLQPIKDQIASDLSEMTEAKKASWINKNRSQLQKIYGSDYSIIDSIKNDILSQNKTKQSANATFGPSTATKLSDVMSKVVTGKEPVKKPTFLSTVVNSVIKGGALGAGGYAALTHPVVAIPALMAAYGIKSLKEHSYDLIKNEFTSALMHPERAMDALKAYRAAENVAPNILQRATANVPDLMPSILAGKAALDSAQKVPNQNTQLDDILSSIMTKPSKPKILSLSRNDMTNDNPVKKVSYTESPLINAVIQQESAGNPNAVSNKGAIGLMQLMPATGHELAKELNLTNYDLADPKTNQMLGTYYLQKLMKMFNNDPELALTAYHSGPGRVQKLLKLTGGNKLDDIIEYLGPVGQKYAREILTRLYKAQTGMTEA